MFSSTMFGLAAVAKSQPARVYGTHGAGAFKPSLVNMFGVVSVGTSGLEGSKIGAVQ